MYIYTQGIFSYIQQSHVRGGDEARKNGTRGRVGQRNSQEFELGEASVVSEASAMFR